MNTSSKTFLLECVASALAHGVKKLVKYESMKKFSEVRSDCHMWEQLKEVGCSYLLLFVSNAYFYNLES